MSLITALLLMLLSFVCSGWTAHKTSSDKRNDWLQGVNRAPKSDVRRNNAGSLEQDIWTEKGKYARPVGYSNSEIHSRKRRARRGFNCGHGHYIPTRWVCDGEPHCTNGRDEKSCFDCGYGNASIHIRKVCDGYTHCNNGRDENCFDCRDGDTIYSGRVCNGLFDCTNELDEDDCTTITCPDTHYKCDDEKTCYHKSAKCDSYQHCWDFSDERNCPNLTCPYNHQFLCNGLGPCYTMNKQCDGFSDCLNNEDEENCLNAMCPNEDHFFRCNSGQCMFQIHRCDGKPDCEDQSDELDCQAMQCTEGYYMCPDRMCQGRMHFCEYVYSQRMNDLHNCPRPSGIEGICHNYTCFDTVNTFHCATGECIHWSHVILCDAVADCPDGSDELACKNHTCSTEYEYQCDSGQCIASFLLCDTVAHCSDDSDEASCENFVCPTGWYNTFQCATGHCIKLESLCDHKPDCPDKSDESSCENHTCEFFHFRCTSGQCISAESQCDGQGDCFDGSDEVNCQFSCPSDHLRCDNDQCYPVYKHCNGLQECKDNIDEKNCANDTRCPLGHLPCVFKSSQCIPDFFLCDGIIDCNDTSDESYCGDKTCYEDYHYKCSNGRCIPLVYKCDYLLQRQYGLTLCSDEADNVTCNSHTCKNDFDFRCNNGYCISLEQKCNFRVDCPDGSDEDHCDSKCDKHTFNCSNGRCIARSAVCNRLVDCGDGGDERYCKFHCTSSEYQCESGHCIPIAGLCNGYFEVYTRDRCPVFHDDEKYCPFRKTCPLHYIREPTGGCSEIKHRTDINCSKSEKSDICPNKCPNNLYYIQCCNCSCVHRVSICDGINDCPDGADERNCGRAECRADQFYCSNITCFPLELKCDGFSHCPQGHDENNCAPNETTTITEHNTKTVVTQKNQEACFDPSICLTAEQICKSTGRCHMEIENTDCFLLCSTPCKCRPVGQMYCKQRVESISSVKDDSKILWPFNNSNRIYSLHSNLTQSEFFTFETISIVSITYASLRQVPTRLLSCTFNIQHLDLSHNTITHIAVGVFGRLYLLSVLDLSHNQISSIEDFSFKGIRVLLLRLDENEISNFGIDLFSGIAIDGTLKTDGYRFCCIRPPHLPEHNCYPKADQFSSCKDLLKNTVLSIIVWIIGFVTLFGNIIVILLMVTVEKESLTKNHGVMITNLAVADVLMSVYLLSIASVDTMYRDIYITKDYEWRNSAWCSVVGVLCMISSEASVFFICLITVDRYLIVKYPFGQVRLSRSNIIIISLCIWLSSIAIAVIPLIITPYFKGTFYSKSGVCIALPLTTDSFDGWEYSFAISVCVNFILLIIVGVGQFQIVRELVLSERSSLVSTRQRNDITIAIKLTFIVISDVCCWVPIGVLGIMALTGFQIHPDTYAFVVVFVLPINSALNPFLYTIIAELSKYMKNRSR